MYTLRRITSEHSEINENLGDSYNLIYRERNSVDFYRTLDVMKWTDEEANREIYGFVVCFEGRRIIPLYEKSVYFVMTENGATFANITKK